MTGRRTRVRWRPIQGAHGKAREPRGQPRIAHLYQGEDGCPLLPHHIRVLALMADGYTTLEIAKEMGAAFETVRDWNKRIYASLGVARPGGTGKAAAAVAVAFRRGWIE